MVAGEIISAVVTAAIGLVGICIGKSKCFFRDVGDDGCQWGVAFSDRAIIPSDDKYQTVSMDQNDVIIMKK